MNNIRSVITLLILIVVVFLVISVSNNTYQQQKIYELDMRVNVLEDIIWNRHLATDKFKPLE